VVATVLSALCSVVKLKRYKTYVRLLRVKTAAALRETDAKPPSTLIGQLDGEHLPGESRDVILWIYSVIGCSTMTSSETNYYILRL